MSTGGTPTGIAPSRRTVWVGAGEAGVVGIDTRTSRVTHRIHTSGAAGWTAHDARHVWVPDFAGTDVVRIDPSRVP